MRIAECALLLAVGTAAVATIAAPLETRTAAAAAGGPSFESVDACRVVPGDAVARAVAGRLVEARPVNAKGFVAARCIYVVEIAGARRAFVVWLNPAEDFGGLRKATDRAVKPVKGIGDDAYLWFDEETKRHWLVAVKIGKVTTQVTGEQVDWVQSIARLVLSRF